MNLSPAESLLLWVVSSILAGLAARGLVARSTALRTLVSAGLGRLLAELALLAYFVGWPLLALFNGALSADLIGLGRIGVIDAGLILGFAMRDWLRQAATAGLAVGFALIVAWLTKRTTTPDEARAELPAGLAWRDAVYAEFHWAFCRAPFILLVGDAYWGALAGLALVLAEWRWLGWPPSSRGPAGQFVQLCCAFVSALLCAIAHNFWLAVVAQFVIRRYWPGASAQEALG